MKFIIFIKQKTGDNQNFDLYLILLTLLYLGTHNCILFYFSICFLRLSSQQYTRFYLGDFFISIKITAIRRATFHAKVLRFLLETD